jgi:hypothetical protein
MPIERVDRPGESQEATGREKKPYAVLCTTMLKIFSISSFLDCTKGQRKAVFFFCPSPVPSIFFKKAL